MQSEGEQGSISLWGWTEASRVAGREREKHPSRTLRKPSPWHRGPRMAGAGRGQGSRGTVCLISGRTLGLCLAAQSYLTRCNPTDSSPPGSSVHGDSPGKNTGVGCRALLQGIFPTQGPKRCGSLTCPALLGRFSTISATWETHINYTSKKKKV